MYENQNGPLSWAAVEESTNFPLSVKSHPQKCLKEYSKENVCLHKCFVFTRSSVILLYWHSEHLLRKCGLFDKHQSPCMLYVSSSDVIDLLLWIRCQDAVRDSHTDLYPLIETQRHVTASQWCVMYDLMAVNADKISQTLQTASHLSVSPSFPHLLTASTD